MRRRSKQPLSLVSAVIVEVVTLLAIVALAQPTWTRQVVERLAHPAAPTAETAGSAVSRDVVPQSMQGWNGGKQAALNAVAGHATDLPPGWAERIAGARVGAEFFPILPPPNEWLYSLPRRY